MREVGRRCQRCQYGWYATPPGSGPAKPRWYDEAGSFWTDGQARMTRRISNHERHQQLVAAYEQCPNCGSRSVKTDKTPSFVPTGAITAAATAGGPPVPTEGVNSGGLASGRDDPAPPPKGPTAWQRIGRFHARHWRIIWATFFALAPLGSFGEDSPYTHGTVGNALLFVVIFVGCWTIAGLFLTLHLRHLRDGRDLQRSGELPPPTPESTGADQ